MSNAEQAKWDFAHYSLIIFHVSQNFLCEGAKFNKHFLMLALWNIFIILSSATIYRVTF